MDNQEYEQCIACHTNLLEEPIDLSVGVVYDLLFCPNKSCSRYLLFTNTPQENK